MFILWITTALCLGLRLNPKKIAIISMVSEEQAHRDALDALKNGIFTSSIAFILESHFYLTFRDINTENKIIVELDYQSLFIDSLDLIVYLIENTYNIPRALFAKNHKEFKVYCGRLQSLLDFELRKGGIYSTIDQLLSSNPVSKEISDIFTCFLIGDLELFKRKILLDGVYKRYIFNNMKCLNPTELFDFIDNSDIIYVESLQFYNPIEIMEVLESLRPRNSFENVVVHLEPVINLFNVCKAFGEGFVDKNFDFHFAHQDINSIKGKMKSRNWDQLVVYLDEYFPGSSILFLSRTAYSFMRLWEVYFRKFPKIQKLSVKDCQRVVKLLDLYIGKIDSVFVNIRKDELKLKALRKKKSNNNGRTPTSSEDSFSCGRRARNLPRSYQGINTQDPDKCPNISKSGFNTNATDPGTCSATADLENCSAPASLGTCSATGDLENCSATASSGTCSATGDLENCSAPASSGTCSATGDLENCSATASSGTCSATGDLENCSATASSGTCSATGDLENCSVTASSGKYPHILEPANTPGSSRDSGLNVNIMICKDIINLNSYPTNQIFRIHKFSPEIESTFIKHQNDPTDSLDFMMKCLTDFHGFYQPRIDFDKLVFNVISIENHISDSKIDDDHFLISSVTNINNDLRFGLWFEEVEGVCFDEVDLVRCLELSDLLFEMISLGLLRSKNDGRILGVGSLHRSILDKKDFGIKNIDDISQDKGGDHPKHETIRHTSFSNEIQDDSERKVNKEDPLPINKTQLDKIKKILLNKNEGAFCNCQVDIDSLSRFSYFEIDSEMLQNRDSHVGEQLVKSLKASMNKRGVEQFNMENLFTAMIKSRISKKDVINVSIFRKQKKVPNGVKTNTSRGYYGIIDGNDELLSKSPIESEIPGGSSAHGLDSPERVSESHSKIPGGSSAHGLDSPERVSESHSKIPVGSSAHGLDSPERVSESHSEIPGGSSDHKYTFDFHKLESCLESLTKNSQNFRKALLEISIQYEKLFKDISSLKDENRHEILVEIVFGDNLLTKILKQKMKGLHSNCCGTPDDTNPGHQYIEINCEEVYNKDSSFCEAVVDHKKSEIFDDIKNLKSVKIEERFIEPIKIDVLGDVGECMSLKECAPQCMPWVEKINETELQIKADDQNIVEIQTQDVTKDTTCLETRVNTQFSETQGKAPHPDIHSGGPYAETRCEAPHPDIHSGGPYAETRCEAPHPDIHSGVPYAETRCEAPHPDIHSGVPYADTRQADLQSVDRNGTLCMHLKILTPSEGRSVLPFIYNLIVKSLSPSLDLKSMDRKTKEFINQRIQKTLQISLEAFLDQPTQPSLKTKSLITINPIFENKPEIYENWLSKCKKALLRMKTILMEDSIHPYDHSKVMEQSFRILNILYDVHQTTKDIDFLNDIQNLINAFRFFSHLQRRVYGQGFVSYEVLYEFKIGFLSSCDEFFLNTKDNINDKFSKTESNYCLGIIVASDKDTAVVDLAFDGGATASGSSKEIPNRSDKSQTASEFFQEDIECKTDTGISEKGLALFGGSKTASGSFEDGQTTSNGCTATTGIASIGGSTSNESFEDGQTTSNGCTATTGMASIGGSTGNESFEDGQTTSNGCTATTGMASIGGSTGNESFEDGQATSNGCTATTGMASIGGSTGNESFEDGQTTSNGCSKAGAKSPFVGLSKPRAPNTTHRLVTEPPPTTTLTPKISNENPFYLEIKIVEHNNSIKSPSPSQTLNESDSNLLEIEDPSILKVDAQLKTTNSPNIIANSAEKPAKTSVPETSLAVESKPIQMDGFDAQYPSKKSQKSVNLTPNEIETDPKLVMSDGVCKEDVQYPKKTPGGRSVLKRKCKAFDGQQHSEKGKISLMESENNESSVSQPDTPLETGGALPPKIVKNLNTKADIPLETGDALTPKIVKNLNTKADIPLETGDALTPKIVKNLNTKADIPLETGGALTPKIVKNLNTKADIPLETGGALSPKIVENLNTKADTPLNPKGPCNLQGYPNIDTQTPLLNQDEFINEANLQNTIDNIKFFEIPPIRQGDIHLISEHKKLLLHKELKEDSVKPDADPGSFIDYEFLPSYLTKEKISRRKKKNRLVKKEDVNSERSTKYKTSDFDNRVLVDTTSDSCDVNSKIGSQMISDPKTVNLTDVYGPCSDSKIDSEMVSDLNTLDFRDGGDGLSSNTTLDIHTVEKPSTDSDSQNPGKTKECGQSRACKVVVVSSNKKQPVDSNTLNNTVSDSKLEDSRVFRKKKKSSLVHTTTPEESNNTTLLSVNDDIAQMVSVTAPNECINSKKSTILNELTLPNESIVSQNRNIPCNETSQQSTAQCQFTISASKYAKKKYPDVLKIDDHSKKQKKAPKISNNHRRVEPQMQISIGKYKELGARPKKTQEKTISTDSMKECKDKSSETADNRPSADQMRECKDRSSATAENRPSADQMRECKGNPPIKKEIEPLKRSQNTSKGNTPNRGKGDRLSEIDDIKSSLDQIKMSSNREYNPLSYSSSGSLPNRECITQSYISAPQLSAKHLNTPSHSSEWQKTNTTPPMPKITDNILTKIPDIRQLDEFPSLPERRSLTHENNEPSNGDKPVLWSNILKGTHNKFTKLIRQCNKPDKLCSSERQKAKKMCRTCSQSELLICESKKLFYEGQTVEILTKKSRNREEVGVSKGSSEIQSCNSKLGEGNISVGILSSGSPIASPVGISTCKSKVGEGNMTPVGSSSGSPIASPVGMSTCNSKVGEGNVTPNTLTSGSQVKNSLKISAQNSILDNMNTPTSSLGSQTINPVGILTLEVELDKISTLTLSSGPQEINAINISESPSHASKQLKSSTNNPTIDKYPTSDTQEERSPEHDRTGKINPKGILKNINNKSQSRKEVGFNEIIKWRCISESDGNINDFYLSLEKQNNQSLEDGLEEGEDRIFTNFDTKDSEFKEMVNNGCDSLNKSLLDDISDLESVGGEIIQSRSTKDSEVAILTEMRGCSEFQDTETGFIRGLSEDRRPHLESKDAKAISIREKTENIRKYTESKDLETGLIREVSEDIEGHSESECTDTSKMRGELVDRKDCSELDNSKLITITGKSEVVKKPIESEKYKTNLTKSQSGRSLNTKGCAEPEDTEMSFDIKNSQETHSSIKSENNISHLKCENIASPMNINSLKVKSHSQNSKPLLDQVIEINNIGKHEIKVAADTQTKNCSSLDDLKTAEMLDSCKIDSSSPETQDKSNQRIKYKNSNKPEIPEVVNLQIADKDNESANCSILTQAQSVTNFMSTENMDDKSVTNHKPVQTQSMTKVTSSENMAVQALPMPNVITTENTPMFSIQNPVEFNETTTDVYQPHLPGMYQQPSIQNPGLNYYNQFMVPMDQNTPAYFQDQQQIIYQPLPVYEPPYSNNMPNMHTHSLNPITVPSNVSFVATVPFHPSNIIVLPSNSSNVIIVPSSTPQYPSNVVFAQPYPYDVQPAPYNTVMTQTYPSNVQPAPYNTVMTQTYPSSVQPAPSNTAMTQPYPSSVQPAPSNTAMAQPYPSSVQPPPYNIDMAQPNSTGVQPAPSNTAMVQPYPPYTAHHQQPSCETADHPNDNPHMAVSSNIEPPTDSESNTSRQYQSNEYRSDNNYLQSHQYPNIRPFIQQQQNPNIQHQSPCFQKQYSNPHQGSSSHEYYKGSPDDTLVGSNQPSTSSINCNKTHLSHKNDNNEFYDRNKNRSNSSGRFGASDPLQRNSGKYTEYSKEQHLRNIKRRPFNDSLETKRNNPYFGSNSTYEQKKYYRYPRTVRNKMTPRFYPGIPIMSDQKDSADHLFRSNYPTHCKDDSTIRIGKPNNPSTERWNKNMSSHDVHVLDGNKYETEVGKVSILQKGKPMHSQKSLKTEMHHITRVVKSSENNDCLFPKPKPQTDAPDNGTGINVPFEGMSQSKSMSHGNSSSIGVGTDAPDNGTGINVPFEGMSQSKNMSHGNSSSIGVGTDAPDNGTGINVPFEGMSQSKNMSHGNSSSIGVGTQQNLHPKSHSHPNKIRKPESPVSIKIHEECVPLIIPPSSLMTGENKSQLQLETTNNAASISICAGNVEKTVQVPILTRSDRLYLILPLCKVSTDDFDSKEIES